MSTELVFVLVLTVFGATGVTARYLLRSTNRTAVNRFIDTIEEMHSSIGDEYIDVELSTDEANDDEMKAW